MLWDVISLPPLHSASAGDGPCHWEFHHYKQANDNPIFHHSWSMFIWLGPVLQGTPPPLLTPASVFLPSEFYWCFIIIYSHAWIEPLFLLWLVQNQLGDSFRRRTKLVGSHPIFSCVWCHSISNQFGRQEWKFPMALFLAAGTVSLISCAVSNYYK